jgi:hypothetical protein
MRWQDRANFCPKIASFDSLIMVPARDVRAGTNPRRNRCCFLCVSHILSCGGVMEVKGSDSKRDDARNNTIFA